MGSSSLADGLLADTDLLSVLFCGLATPATLIFSVPACCATPIGRLLVSVAKLSAASLTETTFMAALFSTAMAVSTKASCVCGSAGCILVMATITAAATITNAPAPAAHCQRRLALGAAEDRSLDSISLHTSRGGSCSAFSKTECAIFSISTV